MGNYLSFRKAIPLKRVDSYALLTRSPLSALRRSARLACLRHTASVHPEPGSNSQKKLILLNLKFLPLFDCQSAAAL